MFIRCFFTAEVYMITTEPESPYDNIFMSTKNEYIEFKVAACKDTRVALFQDISPSTSVFYEVVLGSADNTQINLYDSKTGTYPFF